MTTSRQAYRLGVRLGLGRLLGFYYGHIGYYFGQLHFYHCAWLFLAIAFVGAVADGTGVLAGAGYTTALGLNNMYGLIYLLFM